MGYIILRWFHSQAGKAKDCKSSTRGSNPRGTSIALVAQLDRVSDYESEGQEFESLRGHHFQLSRFAALFSYNRELAQFGRAPALGAGGREFKSRTPDHAIHINPVMGFFFYPKWS